LLSAIRADFSGSGEVFKRERFARSLRKLVAQQLLYTYKMRVFFFWVVIAQFEFTTQCLEEWCLV